MTQWAVVTGAAGGIGSAICESLRSEGVLSLGIDKVESAPACDVYAQHDLSDWKGLPSVLSQLAADRDVVGLVNNAAYQPIDALSELSDDSIQEALAVNVASPAVAIRTLTEALQRTKGAVVNVASVHAHATTPGMLIYATSKAALLGLTRSAAVELGSLGIRVNAVTPGAIDAGALHANLEARGVSRQSGLDSLAAVIPLGRVGQAEEIASAVSFLLDVDRSSFLTGAEIVVDGGATVRLGTD